MKNINYVLIGCVMLMTQLSCLATTTIKNRLDYPIKVHLGVETLNDDDCEVGAGQTVERQTGAFYDIARIKSITVWVDEGNGFPEEDAPNIAQKVSLYGSNKQIIVSTGPADKATGESEYFVDYMSDL